MIKHNTFYNRLNKIEKNLMTGLFAAILFSFLLFSPQVSTVYAGSNDKQDKNSIVSGQELEKPRPIFTRVGDAISAKYIPRAKSSSIVTNFKVIKGGKLIDVKGMDFEKAARPEVDVKNYKSALFVIEIGEVSPAGSDAVLVLSSDFFASGTEYRVFNEKLPTPWMNPQCQNMPAQSRVRDLVITIKDGGPYDSDGQADGSITFIGGPRDSFWGYALGTLFIRFFGIFLVLSVLMIGMMLSGAVFSKMQGKKENNKNTAGSDESADEDSADLVSKTDLEADNSADASDFATESVEEAVSDAQEDASRIIVDDYEVAAAIATALHLHFKSSSLNDNRAGSDQNMSAASSGASSNIMSSSTSNKCPFSPNTWGNDGRSQIMRERRQTYNRGSR